MCKTRRRTGKFFEPRSQPDSTVLYTDRNITKAKIYYFYRRDWAQFSTTPVQYTDKYEFRDSLVLMNKNAKMILENSANPADYSSPILGQICLR